EPARQPHRDGAARSAAAPRSRHHPARHLRRRRLSVARPRRLSPPRLVSLNPGVSMSRLSFVAASTLALVAACGGEHANTPPRVDGPVAEIDAPVSIDAPGPPKPTAVAVTGDFSVTGVFSTINVADRQVTANALAGVAGGEPWI